MDWDWHMKCLLFYNNPPLSVDFTMLKKNIHHYLFVSFGKPKLPFLILGMVFRGGGYYEQNKKKCWSMLDFSNKENEILLKLILVGENAI